jgi:hypothetical protein
MNHNKGLNYGEVYGETPNEPKATGYLECLRCDSQNVFLVWPRETERTDVMPAPKPETPPPLYQKSQPLNPEQLSLAFEAAGMQAVHTPASPQAVCRACGLHWQFDWWQCPELKNIRADLWRESKESLAVIGALKAFVMMPEDETELDGNHLYTKYYNMRSRLIFGAAEPELIAQYSPLQPAPDVITEPTNAPDPAAAAELPTSRKRPSKKQVQSEGQAGAPTAGHGRRKNQHSK